MFGKTSLASSYFLFFFTTENAAFLLPMCDKPVDVLCRFYVYSLMTDAHKELVNALHYSTSFPHCFAVGSVQLCLLENERTESENLYCACYEMNVRLPSPPVSL